VDRAYTKVSSAWLKGRALDPIPRSGDNPHSEIKSDKPNQGDLTDKIAIPERRDFFVFQVMLRSKEAIEE
jgi:hypothetical protein